MCHLIIASEYHSKQASKQTNILSMQHHFYANAGFSLPNDDLKTLIQSDMEMIEAAFHMGKCVEIEISQQRLVKVYPKEWIAHVLQNNVILKRFVYMTTKSLPINMPCPNENAKLPLFQCSCKTTSPCFRFKTQGSMSDATMMIERSMEDLPGEAIDSGHYGVEIKSTPKLYKEIIDRTYIPAYHKYSHMIMFSMFYAFMIRTLYSFDGSNIRIHCETLSCKKRCQEKDCMGYPLAASTLPLMAEELKDLCCSQSQQHGFFYQILLLENNHFYKEMFAK
jgi:hypothetical protein